MKKITLLLTIAFVMTLMISCQKENTYTINGVAENYPDGTKVYLMMKEKPNWITVDSATVLKGRFIMKGQVDPGFLGYIGVGDERNMIVVEPGTITIDLSDGNPHGTEANERLTNFNHTIAGMDEQMAEISAKVEALDADDSISYRKLTARLGEIDKEEMDVLSKVIEENIKNPLGVGLYCFYNSAFADDVDFLFNLSKEIPEEYLQQSYVSRVLENVSIISCTSAGNHFTDLALTTREGENVTLESLVTTNKFVLLDFWASWCAPCRQSLPGIRRLHETFSGKGLCIVGISLDEDKKAWETALERYRMQWLQVGELRGWESEHAAAYGVRAIPSTVLIDSTGMIIGRNIEPDRLFEIMSKELNGEEYK